MIFRDVITELEGRIIQNERKGDREAWIRAGWIIKTGRGFVE